MENDLIFEPVGQPVTGQLSPEGCRVLALNVILSAFRAGLRGNEDAIKWLYESDRVKLFCSALDQEHQDLISHFESCQRTRKNLTRFNLKRKKRRKKKQ